MLCFYAQFQTKHLTQDRLIEMFLDWQEHSRNKMNGLNYDGRIPFRYQIDHKELNIQIFKQQYLTLYFSTKDNYKNTLFIVEVIYDFIYEKIHLRFSKETSNESRYISAISIPKIFKTIITSSYIEEDVYPFTYHAHRINKDQLEEIKTEKPLVYMRTRCINANRLATELFGLAHVCYCLEQSEEGCIEIIDDQESRFYQVNKKVAYRYQIREINEIIRNMTIQKYKDVMPSYDALYQGWLYHQQNSAMKNSKEYQKEFQEEIIRRQQEINELKEFYHLMLEDIKEQKQKNDQLLQIQQCQGTALLHIDDMDKVLTYREVLLRYLQHKAQELEATHEIYRRLDILHAIVEKNGGEL